MSFGRSMKSSENLSVFHTSDRARLWCGLKEQPLSHKNVISCGDHRIGHGEPPFIIAEMSGNHHQSLDRALELVEAAAESGAQALKIQTYTADTMTLDIQEREFVIQDPKSLWKGNSLYSLYERAHTPWP